MSIMNTMFKLLGSVLCFCLVSPAFTHYIFDENLNGYLSAADGAEDFGKNRMPSHKKFYRGSSNQNVKLLNERAVDLHFKMQNPSPSTFAEVSMDTLIPVILSDGSSNNHRQLKIPEHTIVNNPKRMENKFDDASTNLKTTTYRNEIPLRNNEMYFIPNKNQDAIKGIYHENQRNVNLNHYRFQIASDRNRQDSMNNPKSNSPEHKKNQISENDERTPHKTKANIDRNAKGPSRSENQQRASMNSLKQDENRKRDIAGMEKNYSENVASKENEKFVSFNGGIKQFQQGLHLARHVEEKVEKRERNKSPARIQRYNIKTKANNKPYALFYVMNHENFDQPERILSEEVRSYDQEPVDHFYNRVTNYRNTNSKNQSIKNYAVFRDR